MERFIIFSFLICGVANIVTSVIHFAFKSPPGCMALDGVR